jgi:hypothetical protein
MLNNLGDGSTLSLDFTTGVLDPRLTFTRSTTATYINSQGYVTTMAAAPTNDPTKARFDYDPTTLAPRGLLIEASASNYVLQSGLNPFASPTWQTSGTTLPTITAGYTGNGFAPDNTSNPTRVQFAVNGGSASRITQQTSYTTNPTAAAPYTVSVWMKSNTAGTNYTINILGTDGAGLAFTVTPTWQRFTLVNTSGTSLVGQVYISNNSTSVAADVLIWGAQLEAGNGASSYIPTGASTGNRAFDSCVMTGTNFSSWFAGATEGVFYAEYEAPRSLGTADYFCLGTTYAAGTFIGMNLANSTRYPQALISPGGGFRVSGGISVAASTPMKHAAKWSGVNNVLVFANGAVGTAHSATSGTPTLTMFSIGSSSTSGTAATGDYLNACMRRVKFWPVALSDSQIISITT